MSGLTADPAILSDGSPSLLDGETIVRELQAGVGLLIGDSLDCGTGALFITSRRLVWLKDDGREKGYEVPFRSITMHAISRDPDASRGPCIYAQIDGNFFDGEMEDEAANGGEDLEPMTEARLFLPDSAELQSVFQTLCDIAAQNPDSGSEAGDEDEDSDGPGFFYNEDEALAGAGAEARAAVLARLQAALDIGGEGEMEGEGDEWEGDDRFEEEEGEGRA